MRICVFPGQGSQYINMGEDLYNKFALVKKLFKEAEEISSLPITNTIFNGNSVDLQSTDISQVAIMVTSIATLGVMEEMLETQVSSFANYVAGHSLGEYTALVASGILTFAEAVKLLTIRGKAMKNSDPQQLGGMLAVIGITDINTIKEIASKSSNSNSFCEIANDNSVGQIILSGHKSALELAAKVAKEEYKAKLVKFLDVSGPFHSSLMQPAVDIMKEFLPKLEFKKGNIPLISNVTADVVTDNNQFKDLLLQQIVSPVRWRESILQAVKLGVTSAVEIGPNKVLTGLNKRIDSNLMCCSISTLNDIENFKL